MAAKKAGKKGKPIPKAHKRHTVKVIVRGKRVTCEPYSVVVSRGDLIEWKLDKVRPFGVVVKAAESPLSWPDHPVQHVAAKGHRALVAKVKADAASGFYDYAMCVCVGPTLVIDDPEIIIPPPKGGRG